MKLHYGLHAILLSNQVKEGAEVGRHVVSFGNATGGNSTSEQSVVVWGYRAVVVNNYVEDQVTDLCAVWFAALDVSDKLKHECPFLFGEYANGIEQFELDPTTGAVTSTWANPDVSCTSVIPVVSTADGTLYCVGKRPRPKKRDSFTVEAVDWATGKSLYHVETTAMLYANGLYASTIIGDKGDIVMGNMAGVTRWSSTAPASSSASPSPASAAADEHDERLLRDPRTAAAARVVQQLADWYAAGVVPTEADVAALGLGVPGMPK